MKTKAIPKAWIWFLIAVFLLLVLVVYSACEGSVRLSIGQLWRGLFVEYDKSVAIVYDLRFPRIVIAILGGAGLGAAGVLLQAAMQNPLTDPGIIGISSGSSLAGMLVLLMFPHLYFWTPLLSVLGGLLVYFLIYSLAWSGGIQTIRLILSGVALNMIFAGGLEMIRSITGGNLVVTAILQGNATQKTWTDAKIMLWYTGIALVISLFFIPACNLLRLEDKTARAIGVNVERNRFWVAFVAIILSSVATTIMGVVGFIGLIIPHIGRILVGSNHKWLLPFSMISGAVLLLLSDTLGRLLTYPYEIPAAVVMTLIGGPFFVILLKISGFSFEKR